MTESNKNVVATIIFFAGMVLVFNGLTGIVLKNMQDASPAEIQAAIAACPGVAKVVKSERTVISAARLSGMLSNCKLEIRYAEQQLADDATLEVQQRAAVPSAPK